MHRSNNYLFSPNNTNQTDCKMNNKWNTPNKSGLTKPQTTSKKKHSSHHNSGKKNLSLSNEVRD